LIDDGATQTQYDTAAAAAKVAYISSQAVSTQVGTKLKAKTIGIVNEDPGLHSVLGFSTVRAETNANVALSTVSTHYITSSFSGGAVTLFTSSQPVGAAAGTLPAGLFSIGTWSSGTLSPLGGLLTLEAGAAIAGGGTAAGRRVQMPWDGVEGGAVADIGALSADGRTILQRSLTWAAGLEPLTGPIAHWKLDDATGTTAIDSAGGHHGTLAGGAAWTTGALGGGLALNGVSDYVTVANDPSLSLTQAFTLMAFVRASELVGYQVIMDKGSVIPDYNYSLFTTGDEIYLGFSVGGTYVDFPTTNANLQTNRWYHIAATFNNSTDQVRIYLDGAQIYSNNAATVQPQVNNGVLWLGRSQWTDEHWAGVLDDLRIYDRVLSATEIGTIATSGGVGGGGGVTQYYLDEFPDFTCDGADEYRGSSGTLDWSTQAWVETGDDGRACGANLRVMDDPLIADATGNRLRLQNKNRAATRQVDLSGLTKANLTFDYRRDGMTGSANIQVQISGNGGGSWTTVLTIPAGTDTTYQKASQDISAFIASNTMIRFSVDGSMKNEAYIDNVRIDAK
jgi:hypothetical protein